MPTYIFLYLYIYIYIYIHTGMIYVKIKWNMCKHWYVYSIKKNIYIYINTHIIIISISYTYWTNNNARPSPFVATTKLTIHCNLQQKRCVEWEFPIAPSVSWLELFFRGIIDFYYEDINHMLFSKNLKNSPLFSDLWVIQPIFIRSTILDRHELRWNRPHYLKHCQKPNVHVQEPQRNDHHHLKIAC